MTKPEPAPTGRRPLHVVPAAGEWEAEPVPLSARRLLPPFPVDTLPAWLGDQVAAVAEFTQTPADLAGCIGLAALSTAAGGRAVVEVRPGWREPVNLFTAVAMPPGSRKSAVFAAMTTPLLAAEAALVELARPVVVEAELAARVARAHAERTAKAAEVATNAEARMNAFADASSAALAAEEISVPVLPRLIADDVTPEAAASLLAEQGGRLAVLSAEAGIFTTLAGRYSGAPNLEVFLKGHAGDMLRVDRKGRPAEHVEQPALTLGLAVQPEVLVDIAQMPGFRGRGLLARILYALPPNTVGRRRVGAPPPAEDITTGYATQLRGLVLTLADWTDPAVLPLAPDADALVLELEAAIEPRLDQEAGDLAHLADWVSKLTGATVRIAGLLHLAAHHSTGWNRPISAAAVESAAQLGHYFLAHALAVFDHMGADPLIDDARTVLAWITRTGAARFTRRDAFNDLRGSRFRKVTDLDPALGLLADHGHLRPVPAPLPAASGGRPPSPAYDVHPSHAEPAQPAQPPAGGRR
ncbi:MAG TPA: YfjI family protein [Mycobacteriales bacterium]|nr:YfjI family protein [Mycobacteriales bacterium]